MPMFIRKDGEKTTLLSKCGELLFGCSGKMLVTQGIYIPRSLSPSPDHFICKRAVWVPDSLSHECLVHNLESFGATLPFSIQRVASLHHFGLCGVNPTRTVHANDKHFFLLAKVPHKQFAVYGIVEIGQTGQSSAIIIESISTNKDDIISSVEWVLNEFALHHLSKQLKNKRRKHCAVIGQLKNQSQSLATEGMQETQGKIQHRSVETESEQSEKTPQSPIIILCDSENSPSSSFNGVDMQGPHPLFLIP